MNKINLITGETYTLSELFSGERCIVIPDLQRDYCWGDYTIDEKHRDTSRLVNDFITTLSDHFREHKFSKLNMGLLYGYETPENYVQLCDGQQRVTTLYLIAGMMIKWSGDVHLHKWLVNRYENKPFLQYAIRDTSIYFLSDIVDRFFEPDSEIPSAEDIKSAPWFYGEYFNDPSVMSMLAALKTIEKRKDEFYQDDNPDFLRGFFEFLTERLTFIYYDMGSRSNGEETYVIINTTGEPLTATENLKPIVLNIETEEKEFSVGDKTRLSKADAWEEMENWFWIHKNEEKYDTADPGYNEFLRWVTLLHYYDNGCLSEFKRILASPTDFVFPYAGIDISKIVDTFNAFTFLYDNHRPFIENTGDGESLSQNRLFVLLPLIKQRLTFPEADALQFERLFKFLENLLRISNVTKAINEVVTDALTIASECRDITEALQIEGLSKTIMTEEEILKLQILKDNTSERADIERKIWELQDWTADDGANLFLGEIIEVLKWAGAPSAFSLASFTRYVGLIKTYIKPGDNDTTRRALIAFGLPNYPLNNSYAWCFTEEKYRDKTWQNLISLNSESFKDFLDKCDNEGLDNIINNFLTFNTITDYYNRNLVKYPSLLRYSNKKNSYNFWGPTLYQRDWAKPIPVALAIILERLGLEIRRDEHTLPDYGWKIDLYDNSLTFKPLEGDKKIESLVVMVHDVRQLRFEITFAGIPTKLSLKKPVALGTDMLIERLTGNRRPATKKPARAKKKPFLRNRRYNRPTGKKGKAAK